MPKQFIAELKDRDAVASVFMVKEKTMAMAKNGKPYMNLKFMDKSGEVDGKLSGASKGHPLKGNNA